MSNFHLGPFKPNLGKVLDILEVDHGGLLKYLACTSEVCFRFTCSPAFLVELGKVDIQAVEVRCSFARGDG